MRKKLVILLLMMAIMGSMCTGCTKYYYEQDEARAMGELGRDIVSAYIEENDMDATIVSYEPTIYGGPVRYLTSYAEGFIEEDGITYKFYVDTETEQIYTGKYEEELSEAIRTQVYDFMGLTEQDFINIDKAGYELVLPNKWGNENVPREDVVISAGVVPIEVTDIDEYLASDDVPMFCVTLDASVRDNVDLSFIKDTGYLAAFAAANIIPSSINLSNRLFSGYMCRTHMFYSEYELVDFEEFEMAVMTHHFSMYRQGTDIDEYTYSTDDVTIDVTSYPEGDAYCFSLLQRYDGEFDTTRLNFYFTGDNPPDLSYSFPRDGKQVTGDCHWEECDDGVWRLRSEHNTRVFEREEFVIYR